MTDNRAKPEVEKGYAYQVLTVRDAVERAVSGEWDIPEFQRQFVWQPAQVCALADSLWRNYPIGALLLWRRAADCGGAPGPRWWVADGQQRLTSLCLLCGREPVWLTRRPAEFRRRLLQSFDIRFDVAGASGSNFVSAASPAKSEDMGLLPVSSLLGFDLSGDAGRNELERIAADLTRPESIKRHDTADISQRLYQVGMIPRRELVVTAIHRERQDVLEIFARLNSRGMKFRRLLLKLAMEEIPAAIRGARGVR